MSASVIPLESLPSPDIIETVDFEAIVAAMKADLVARIPELADTIDLESEPNVALLQVVAYREVLVRARINDATRGSMLAYATGADLDNLAALFGVARQVEVPAQLDAVPPVPAVMESDVRLRSRTQLSLEAITSCGTRGSYLFQALSASASVKDAFVSSPVPGQVQVAIISTDGDGAADPALVAAVQAYLDDEDRRQLCDIVSVVAAAIVDYTVDVTLTLYEGPDSAVVLAAAQADLEAYVDARHRIGHDVTLAGITGALWREGVQNISIASPAADIVIDDASAAHCSGVTVNFGGRDV